MLGQPGSAGMLQNEGDEEGYLGTVAPLPDTKSGWTPAATTDSGMYVASYRPMDKVDLIDVPVLVVAAELDTLCPLKFVTQTFERIPKGEFLKISNAGHFDICTGKALDDMLKTEIDFFNRYL